MTIVNGVRLVSNSEITTHQDCPRKWWLAWYRGLTPRAVNHTGALATGTRLHAALAAWYTPNGSYGDAVNTLKQLHEEALVASARELDEWDFTPVLDAELKKAFDLEFAMLEGYLQWLAESGADQHLEVIAAEEYVEVTLEHGGDLRGDVKLIGKLDALVRHTLTGDEKFIDHKTVGSFSIPGLRQNAQMLHYEVIQWLRRGVGDVQPYGALYNMLRKVKRTRASKPPYFERRAISHNHLELEAHIYRVVNVIVQIEIAEELLNDGGNHHVLVPARPSNDCHWKCPFFQICPMFDDGSRVEAKIEADFEVRDPLHYYAGKEKASE